MNQMDSVLNLVNEEFLFLDIKEEEVKKEKDGNLEFYIQELSFLIF